MTPGDLTIACERRVQVGHDMAVRADRHTRPATEHWILCVSTDRTRIHVGGVTPPPLDYALDEQGVLNLMFPAEVLSIEMTMDAGEIGEAEWRFWLADAVVIGRREQADA